MPFSNSARAPRNQRQAPSVTNPKPSKSSGSVGQAVSSAATKQPRQLRRIQQTWRTPQQVRSTNQKVSQVRTSGQTRRQALQVLRSLNEAHRSLDRATTLAALGHQAIVDAHKSSSSPLDELGHTLSSAGSSAIHTAGAAAGEGLKLLNTHVGPSIPQPLGTSNNNTIPVSGKRYQPTVGDAAAAVATGGELAPELRGAAKVASAVSDTKTAGSLAKSAEKAVGRAKSAVKERPRPIKATKAKVAESKPVQAVKETKAKATEKVAQKVPQPAKDAVDATVNKAKRVKVPKPIKQTAHAANAPFRNPGKTVLAAGGGAEVVGTAKSGKPGALPEGIYNAVVHHPGDVAGTTARAIPGLVTAPIGMAANLGLTGYRAATTATGLKHYSGKEILAPTESVAKQTYDFGKGMVDTYASGNEKRIEDATRHTYGLTPLLIAGIPGAKALHGKERGAITEPEAGLGKVKVRVGEGADAREIAPVKNRRIRRQVSRDTARAQRKGEAEAHAAAKPLLKLARKLPGAHKTFRRAKGIGPEDTVKVVAEEGIRTPAHVDKALARHAPGTPAHDALTYLKDHPELLKNKHYGKLLYKFRQQAREIETSVAKKHSAQALTYGVKTPAQRYEEIARKEYQAGLDTKAQELAAEVKHGEQHGAAPGLSLTEKEVAKRLNLKRAHLARAQKRAGEGFDALPDAQKKALITRAETQNHAQVLKQFETDMRKVQQEHGLAEGAYTADVNAGRRDNSLKSEPPYPKRMAQKQHKSEDILRKGGTADQSFGTLLQRSVISPRLRRAAHENTHRFVEENAIPVHVPGPNGVRTTRYLTSEEIRRAVEEGQLDPAKHAIFDAQHFRQAVLDPTKPEVIPEKFRAPLSHDILTREAEAKGGLKLSKGKKYIVADKAAIDEFAKQHTPTHVPVLGKLQRASSAAILGFSPTWLLAQPLAEGAQALASVGPVNIARGLSAYRKLSDAEKRKFDAQIGTTSGIGSIQEAAMSLGGDLSSARTRVGKALERSAPGRVVHGLLTGKYAANIDRTKGNAIRRAVAAGHVSREYNGFTSALNNLLKKQDEIAGTLKGKPLDQQLRYFADHQPAARKLESYVDDVMGNWTALTRNEKAASALVIFYPFVRMSLEWTFHTFPARHPLKAAILNFLAQENADQIHKMLHGDPSYFTQWASAPIYAGRGKNLGKPTGILPLQRIAPGSNALIEAAGTGNGPRDLLHVANPVVASTIAALGGYNPSSGGSLFDKYGQPAYKDVGKSLLNSLSQLPAPLRTVNAIGPLAGKLNPPSGSPTSKFFNKNQPSPLEKLINPFPVQKTSQAAQQAEVGRLTTRSYSPLPTPQDAYNIWKGGNKAEAEKAAQHTLDTLAAKKVREQFFKHEGLYTNESPAYEYSGIAGVQGETRKFVEALTGHMHYSKALDIFRGLGLNVGPKKLQRKAG